MLMRVCVRAFRRRTNRLTNGAAVALLTRGNEKSHWQTGSGILLIALFVERFSIAIREAKRVQGNCWGANESVIGVKAFRTD